MRGVSRVEFLESRRLLAATLVSVNPAGVAGDEFSRGQDVSPDGRYVAFVSRASDLVSGVADTSGDTDVFLRDRVANTTVLISRSAAGNVPGNSDSSELTRPSVSDDGRFVVFQSRANDLVA